MDSWCHVETETVHSNVLLAIPLQQPAMRQVSAFQAAHGGRQWENQNKPRTWYILQNPEVTVHLNTLRTGDADLRF